MQPRIYLDTSTISVYFDARAQDRRVLTEEFFQRVDFSRLCTSEVARWEIERTPDEKQRRAMLDLLSNFEIISLNEEMRAVGREYMLAGVFPSRMMLDAYHVAAASVSGIPILVSWNFKHLVNRRRRAAVLDVNLKLGLIALEIIAPPEL